MEIEASREEEKTPRREIASSSEDESNPKREIAPATPGTII